MVQGSVPRDTLSNLLKILRYHGNENLPLDGRTLLKTPVNVDVDNVGGGDYAYIGIAAGLRRIYALYPGAFQNSESLI